VAITGNEEVTCQNVTGAEKIREDKIREDSSESKEIVNKEIFDYKKEFETMWELYPRKEGKKASLRHFKVSIKNKKDLKKFSHALDNYKKKLLSDGTTMQYTKSGSTFFNNWEDYYSAPSAFVSMEPTKAYKEIQIEKQEEGAIGGKAGWELMRKTLKEEQG